MKKALWLAAVSTVALCAGAAPCPAGPSGRVSVGGANPARVLWNQNSNYNDENINSQNYTTGFTSSSDQAADDFVIPRGETWSITEVDVTGTYYQGSGPAISENVVFYKNGKGMPGVPVKSGTFDNLDGGSGPNFVLRLPGRGLKLKAGHYWVSVIADENFDVVGKWGWDVNSVQHGNPAMWRNPGGGYFICYTWEVLENCADVGPDLMFSLKGSSK